MAKALVAYFSASGVTAALAKRLAESIEADLFEIKPETPYTNADLNWMNKSSRSSVEMADRASRPAIASKVGDMASYDVVFIGFPVWWYREPSIIDTFVESYDFSGKTIIPFCSHGGGRFGQSLTAIAKLAPYSVIGEGLSVHYSGGSTLDEDIAEWLKENGIDEK